MSKKISEKELVKIFNELKEKLGRIPTRDEIGHREPIKRLYGGYSNFVRELGYLPNLFRTKNDYIKYVQYLYKELNKIPSQTDLEEKGVYIASVYRIFGSYNNLLKEAGFETREKFYTDKTEEELLLDYINKSNELGRWAKTRELDSIDIYENRFGSIIEVRKMVANDERLNIKDKSIEESNQLYTDEELKEFILDAIGIHGNNIKKTEFIEYLKNVSGPSINTIMKRFKTTSFKNLIDMFQG